MKDGILKELRELHAALSNAPDSEDVRETAHCWMYSTSGQIDRAWSGFFKSEERGQFLRDCAQAVKEGRQTHAEALLAIKDFVEEKFK